MTQDTQQILTQARQLTETGKHEEARLSLLKLLKVEPDNLAALLMLGGAYFSLEKYSEAEMVFERLVLKDPGKGEYSIALFNTLWKLARHDEALEEIKRFMQHADKEVEKETIDQYMDIIKGLET